MASTVNSVAGSLSELHENKTKSFKEMSFKEKLTHIRHVITVEPIIACYLMSGVLCGPALNQLELEKACKADAGFNETVCVSITSGLEEFAEERKKVQTIITEMHAWQGPLQSVMPLILVLFLGSYSDRHKLRKPFLLIPIIGEFFAVAGCILCVIFMKELPLAVQGVAQTVVPSFLGGQAMIVMAVFSYIADISTMEMRTLRIGIVQIVLNICYPLIQSFSGILFLSIGYIGILSIAAVIYLVGLLYGYFCIKETRTPVTDESKKSLLVDIFDPRYAIETFSLLVKKKEGNNRLFVCFIMIILFISTGVIVGEVSMMFLYTNISFNWTVVDFSYFITVNTLIHLVGTAVALPLFANIFKFSDYVIILLAFLDKILSNLIMAFSKTTTGLYVGTAVSIITGVSTIGIRSAATKVVTVDDLGKAQSLFGIMEAIAPAISIPGFNWFYEVTLDIYSAAFFIIGCIFFFIACVLLMIIYIMERRKSNQIQETAPVKNEKYISDMQDTYI